MIPQLILYALLALTVAVCTYLFLTVKRDLRVLETRNLRRSEGLRSRVKELADELETLRQELATMEQKSDPMATVARTLGSGVRTQALRMIKHGEGPEHIAAALSLPRSEVELLIKVQRLVTDPVLQPTA